MHNRILALLALGALWAPRTIQTPSGGPAAQAPAAGFAELDQAFRDAVARWDDPAEAARREALPPRERPKEPAVEFFPRFEELAARGEGRAWLWMGAHLSDAGLSRFARTSKTGTIFTTLFTQYAAEPWIEEGFILLATRPRDVERAKSDAWCRAAIQGGATPGVRAAALYALAEIVTAGGRSDDPRDLDEAATLCARVLKEFPGTRAAALAADAELSRIDIELRGGDPETWPEGYKRVELLAQAGSGEATLWLLTHLELSGLDDEARAERGEELCELLVDKHATEPFMSNFAALAPAIANSLGIEVFEPLFVRYVTALKGPAPRLAALTGYATWLAGNDAIEDGPARAEKLFARFDLQFAGSPLAKQLAENKERDAGLAIGATVPDFAGVDVDGKPLAIGDFRGKITVIDFWGFWCGFCVAELPNIKAMLEKHKGEPVAVLGVNTDGDKDAFRKGCVEKGVVWANIFEGSTDGKIPTQFGVRGYPTIYVLDAKGVIRFKNARGEALSKAVETLLAEMKAGEKR